MSPGEVRHACMHAQSLCRVQLLATFGLQPARLLCQWDFPGKDAGVGCHFLLQGIFPIQGSNLSLLPWQVDHFTSEPPGKPKDETESIRSSCAQPTHFLPLNWAWTGDGRVSREPSPLLKPKVMDEAWGRPWVCNSPSHSVVTACVHCSPSSPCLLHKTHRTRPTQRFLGFWCGGDGAHTAGHLPLTPSRTWTLIVVFPNFFFCWCSGFFTVLGQKKSFYYGSQLWSSG